MKQFVNILSVIATVLILFSCSEMTFGDKFLGDRPESSGATIDSMFSSVVNADKVLSKAYANLPYGISARNEDNLGGRSLESITDLAIHCSGSSYYTGGINASSNSSEQVYLVGGETDWTAIRYAWIYIENVNKVPNMGPDVKAQRIAEAKMIIAISYFRMLRGVGGVPWIDHAVSVSETLKFPRLTFAQTVENIVALIDQASPVLLWKQPDVDDGRMTRAGALAFKLKVLLFAASPTFNSNTLWHPKADKYTCYGNEDKKRWVAAREAAEVFVTELDKFGQYELIQPMEDTHMARRLAFRKAYYERGGSEILISTRKGYDESTHSSLFGNRYYWGPSLNYVNMFPWEDGSDFPEDFDWSNPPKDPFYEKNHVPTRDPRLYETAAVPGENYYGGSLAPVYWGHPDYRKGASTGFMSMKFVLTESADRAGKGVQWPYMRMAEFWLSYAEAISESGGGPNQLAYDCVNKVRNRVGLSDIPKGMDKIEFREVLLKERALELGFEDVRWYDLVRWGRVDDFRKKLYFLNTYVKTMNGAVPSSFTYVPQEWTPVRFWSTSWDTKWFLSPIPQQELNKKYGWTQNPGW